MKLALYDTVKILRNSKAEGINKGDIGAVIMVYEHPSEAYEVEFVDGQGATIAQIVLLPTEVEKCN